MWIIFATLSALLYAASNVNDKILLGKIIKQPHTINILGSFMIGIVALVISLMRPVALAPIEILIALVTGILGFLAVTFYLGAIKQEEVSRVAPLWAGIDLLAPILAFFILHEPITVSIAIAMICIIIGSILIESDLKQGIITRKPMVLCLMFFASLSWAIGLTASRAFLERPDPLTLWVWAAFGATFCGLVQFFFLHKGVMRDLHERMTLPGTAISTGTEALGVIARFAALARFAVAPVQFVGGSFFLFVFIAPMFLARWFPELKEKKDRFMVIVKTIAIILITIGVLLAATSE